MMAADYRHIGGRENRLGRHYSRFSPFWPTPALSGQSLALRKLCDAGSNRRSQAKEFVDTFNKWLEAAEPAPPGGVENPPRHPLDDIIDEFNTKYAVVNEAGQAIVYQRVV